MSRLIFSSNLIQEVIQPGIWLVCFSLAVTALTAHSKEGSFAVKKHKPTANFAGSSAHWLPSNRLNTQFWPNSSKRTVPLEGTLGGAPRQLLVAEPKNDDWSINIQKQFPSNNDCSHMLSPLCFDSKDEGPYNKFQHDSYWLVLRKTFHF
jgi:hypothetical protein